MKRVYITYLDHLGKYRDRLLQICDSIPRDAEAIVYTKEQAGAVLPRFVNIRIEILPRKLTYRSVFLQWRLFRKVREHARHSEVVVQDWFKSFALALCMRPLLGFRFRFIYSPVISDFGWLYKRWRGIVPSCGFRYDWIRARGAVLDWWLCHRCDMLLVQSQELVAFYREAYALGGHAIEFNYNAHFPEGAREEGAKRTGGIVQIGFVGNFELHKGARELLEMAHSLPADHMLRIAGRAKGRENERILRQALALPNVKSEGFLSRESLRDFFAEIDALVLFSYHEGSPRVILEFLPYNKPIFLYDNPGTDYCRNLDGVHCYAYGEYRLALADLAQIKATEVRDRSLPESIRENRLGGILGGVFKNV